MNSGRMTGKPQVVPAHKSAWLNRRLRLLGLAALYKQGLRKLREPRILQVSRAPASWGDQFSLGIPEGGGSSGPEGELGEQSELGAGFFD
jgi:hypothetical protein